MKRTHGMTLGGLTAIAIGVFVALSSRHAPTHAPAATSVAPATDHVAAPAAPGPTHPEIGFHSHEHLLEHYRKHGGEFVGADLATYLRLAQTLRDRPAGGDVLEIVRGDGAITRFDRATGAFISFDSDLRIRTFFKPNGGEAYFQRQAEREH